MDNVKMNETVQKLIQKQVNLEMEKYTETQERLDFVLETIINHLSDGREFLNYFKKEKLDFEEFSENLNYFKAEKLDFGVLKAEGFIRACLSILEDISEYDSYLAEIIKSKKDEIEKESEWNE